jgi:glucose/mannose transport system substrate-binding protein
MTGAGGAGGATTEKRVEIFSWWVAPGEAEALQALVDVNKTRNPNDRIFNAAAANHDTARALLATRLTPPNQPPDLFQQGAADLGAFVAANPGKLTRLNEFFAAQGLTSPTVFQEVLDNITVGTDILAMPVNIHRENSLFYNKQIFAANNLTPPTTIPELLAVCATLKAAGITPLATGSEGWILRIMFNSLAMGSMGSQPFHDFMTKSGGVTSHAAALKTAIDVFANVLNNYTNITDFTPDFGWTQAADVVHSGQAAMYFHGDWAKGYYVQLGWTPGIDFGVVGAPGASDTFWYGVDTFSLPVGALDVPGAMDFLTTIASIDGQVAFNKLKGSSPVRSDVPANRLDAEGQKTQADLLNAAIRQPVIGKDAYDNAMLAFAQSPRAQADKDTLYNVYVTSPPMP